jgi:hypothetical protein
MAVSAKLIGIEKLEQALLRAFEQWAEEDVDDKYMKLRFLDDGFWPYPNYPAGGTKRKSGEVVGSPRNIYDLGELYRSGRESFSVTGGLASWNWDARNSSGQPYAGYVHEGLGTNSTPRKWTDDIAIPSKFNAGREKTALLDKITLSFNAL